MSARTDPIRLANCSGGLPLAMDEGGEDSIWPLELYPSWDDAWTAAHALACTGDPNIEEGAANGVVIVWAWEVENHPDEDWWQWSMTPAPPSVEELHLEDFSGLDARSPEEVSFVGPPVPCWLVSW